MLNRLKLFSLSPLVILIFSLALFDKAWADADQALVAHYKSIFARDEGGVEIPPFSNVAEAEAFAAAVATDKSVELIMIDFKQDAEAERLFAQALKKNTTLKEIVLLGALTDIGAQALADALRVNQSLTKITSLQAKEDIKSLILQRLANNKRIRTLWNTLRDISPGLLATLPSKFDELLPELKLMILLDLIELELRAEPELLENIKIN